MVILYALALLYRDNEILLVRRLNKDFGFGLYSITGGKVDPGETVRNAVKREVQEETGLDIPESDFTLVHTLHRKGSGTELLAICFNANISHMPQPRNLEPEKHDDMRFFKVDELPTNIVPAHKQVIENVLNGISYSEHGWQE